MTWYAKNFEDYENVQVAAVDETLESRTLESIRKRERKSVVIKSPFKVYRKSL